MGSTPDIPEVEETPVAATPATAKRQTEVRKSLLQKRQGLKQAWMTRGQLSSKENEL